MVPGINEAAAFPAPRATNSLLRLMEYPNLPLFCFADTSESKKPITDRRLFMNGEIMRGSLQRKNTHIAVGVVLFSHERLSSTRGKLNREASLDKATSPSIDIPCLSHLYAFDSRVESTTVRKISGMKETQ
jgi:hypothetical protein